MRNNAHLPETLEMPAIHAAVVTPHDSNDLTNFPRALVIGVAGMIKVDTVGGESAVTLTVTAGLLPLMVTRVYSTGTTATNIVAIW